MNSIKRILDEHFSKLDVFSIIAVLMNCTFIVFYTYEYDLHQKDFIISTSVLAYVLCTVCIIAFFLGSKINTKYIPILWFLCLTYGLGFFPTYTVFITGGKKYLVLSLSSSLLLLAMMADWVIFVTSSLVGLLFACIVFLITNPMQELAMLHPSKKTYLLLYLLSYSFLSISLFMRQKEKRQEKKMDFMKVFGSAIAHEVNAPLASMKMMADVLNNILQNVKAKLRDDKYSITLDKMDYEMLRDVINPGFNTASTNAIQIVEMLLSALRDKYTNHKTSCEVSVIVKDAIDMASIFDPNGVKIQLIIENDFEINCTRQLMKHVIYNLIKNAFKHGGEEVNIKITVNDFQIIVCDDGVGIPQEKIKKIFDVFFTDGKGSGIGLAFCKFVLNDLNAKISCESQETKYTKFIIDFENE